MTIKLWSTWAAQVVMALSLIGGREYTEICSARLCCDPYIRHFQRSFDRANARWIFLDLTVIH
ncbi:hypothetical protein BBI10_25155 [Pseudomonas graminis]|uniref:Uncharacterized protein n=1 Tax=Pseudomonas graminis TaxID=158627 RepID=A0A1C2D9R0_9PSED|nr:hypothetical protein BBI10_25155 [Pseudomonas graminis]